MKEFKTLKIRPDEEDMTITKMARFGWQVEDSREVYNESQEIVGINGSSYGSQGRYSDGTFNGHANTNSQLEVQTVTHTTHFVSLRFSRETSMKNYSRIKALEEEYNTMAPNYKYKVELTKKPVGLTLTAIIVFIIIAITVIRGILSHMEFKPVEIGICILAPTIAILATVILWIKYNKKHPLEVAENENVKIHNSKEEELFNKRRNEIEEEVRDLIDD